MKKILVICMVLLSFLTFAASNNSKGYGIDAKRLTQLIHDSNVLVFRDKNIKYWDMLMLGTIAVETNYGRFKGDGKYGLTQINEPGLGYIKANLDEDDKKLLKKLKINVSKVTAENLAKNNMAAVVFGSLYYKHKLDSKPPKTPNACAKVWKKYYNTSAGSGTEKMYRDKYNLYKKYLDDIDYGDKKVKSFKTGTIREVPIQSSTSSNNKSTNTKKK